MRFTNEHGLPLVVKPDESGFSRGSHFPITNHKALFAAMLLTSFGLLTLMYLGAAIVGCSYLLYQPYPKNIVSE